MSVTIAESLYGHLVDPKEGAVMSGMMTKQGQNFKTWKRRFFTLHSSPLGATLKYFTDENCTDEKGSLDLSVASVMPKKCEYCSKKFAFEISTPARTLLAHCDTQEEYRTWLNILVLECGFIQPKRDSVDLEEEEEERAAGFKQLKKTTANDDQ
jgi:hypothetical protein